MCRGFCLFITGLMACYTRPESKVERFSYDVPTPSSLRAIFEAILWKPSIRWVVDGVFVLNPIRWMNMVTNEVGKVGTARNGGTALMAEDHVQQRHNHILRDVAYLVFGHFELTEAGLQEGIQAEVVAKYESMFERRASKGQLFRKPYLGMREYDCDVQLVSDPKTFHKKPIQETRDLGIMFYDWEYDAPNGPVPRFFRAQMKNGEVWFPHPDSSEVL